MGERHDEHRAETAAPGVSGAAEHRATALRAAAKAKQHAAVQRAEAGLRALLKTGEPIEFRALARTAGVSVNFLYSHPELRARIEQLRDQHVSSTRPEPRPAQNQHNAVIRTLTAKLTAERGRHRKEVALLREQLAAAHGELLRVRRCPACLDAEPAQQHRP